MIHHDPRLQRLLGAAELAPLRQRLRRHFERLGERDAAGVLQLDRLTPREHEALALLTGKASRPARSARVDIAAIDAALRAAGVCAGLRDALEQLDGPIWNRADADATRRAWTTLAMRPRRDVRLGRWLQTSAGIALLKRLTRQDVTAAEALLTQADAVLKRLPATGSTRAQLAAQALGNAHALDAGRPVASVVLAAWRCAEDEVAEPTVEVELKDGEDPSRGSAERVRDVWARAGVLVNELARPALVLNLPVGDGTRFCGTPGEPEYLSLRRLLRMPPAWAVAGRSVFVCENPNLLAIVADVLGTQCAPLICTDGMPAAAQRTLLDQLRDAGATLWVHADFDWPGLRIANHVLSTWNASAWRFNAIDYEAAALAAPQVDKDLGEAIVHALWDPTLAPAMKRWGRSIAEEAVADGLIQDLRRAAICPLPSNIP